MNDVSEEQFYEDFVYDCNPETDEEFEYDDDSEEAYRIAARNKARREVLEMINEHNNLHLQGLRHVKRTENDGIRTICHSCVCYDMPGIVSMMCFGGITPEGEYVYFWG